MELKELEVNRKGKATEYKRGHYYLTHTEWEDGHTEIEIHYCLPELVWHSCDQRQLEDAKKYFMELLDDPGKKFLPVRR